MTIVKSGITRGQKSVAHPTRLAGHGQGAFVAVAAVRAI